ncbi:hypothetical protein IV81_GL001780 [Pediococcus stilesii]|uniref:Uncharacterized protein n=2 Tax=Pediococcus stilesii TaxID=331679 RepID=A0A0R2KWM8_9LACO|nr:hypothetical protein IV81_GL001780 [Pediococcus stilesii]
MDFMSETILFNPGDSIGNFHDYNEAVKKGHLFKQKQRPNDELVVVTDPAKNEEYAIFYVKDRKHEKSDENIPYDVNKHL